MAKGVQRTWVLIVAGLVALLLVGGLAALQPYTTPLFWVLRTCALLGYLGVFLTALSSAYMKQLVRFFGRPFVKTHHVLAVTGLVLITVHPLAVAWSAQSLAVFVPDFSSWIGFLRLGGRPAWYLIGIASLAALLRASFQQRWRRQWWRIVHMLNYLAFFLATAHAILIGTHFQSPAMKGLAVVLALVLVGVWIQKLLQRRQLRARKR